MLQCLVGPQDLSYALLQSLTPVCAESGQIPICATNVHVALLTNWLPSICYCRQIGSIAWTGSFAGGLTCNHLITRELHSQPEKEELKTL